MNDFSSQPCTYKGLTYSIITRPENGQYRYQLEYNGKLIVSDFDCPSVVAANQFAREAIDTFIAVINKPKRKRKKD